MVSIPICGPEDKLRARVPLRRPRTPVVQGVVEETFE